VFSWLLLPALVLTTGSWKVLVLFLPTPVLWHCKCHVNKLASPSIDFKMWKISREEIIKFSSVVQKFCHEERFLAHLDCLASAIWRGARSGFLMGTLTVSTSDFTSLTAVNW